MMTDAQWDSPQALMLIAQAESGNVDAMFELGEWYHREGLVSERKEMACQWFARAVSLVSVDVARAKLRMVGINKYDQSTLCHIAAQFGFAQLVDIAIADVRSVDDFKQTPLHLSAWFGHEAVAKALITAGADLHATGVNGYTPLHCAVFGAHTTAVEILIAAGADLQATDESGRTPLHYAASKEMATIVGILVAAGADVRVADQHGHTAQDLAKNDEIRSILGNAGVVASAFDTAQSALDAAYATRSRLASLDVISPLIVESMLDEGSFGMIAAICAHADEFADAERVFAAQQDMLRSAERLDEQVVAARDAARQQLVLVAAAVLERHDAAPFGSLAAAGNRVASVKATLVGFETGDDKSEVEFDDWLIGAHKAAALASSLTDRGAESLTIAVQSLAAGGSDTCGRHVVSALARVRFAAEQEKCALDDLRIPRTAHAKLVVKLDELRARVVQALDLADRARKVRVVEAPSGERLLTALSRVAKLEKQVKYARADVEHPDDAESANNAAVKLRELKGSLVEMQRESTAAVVELATHLYDFPELRLRFPKARLDDLFAAGGDASALRTLDLYENRVIIAETRHTVERASFGGVECALKMFRLEPANQRAFVKEARRLRQLAHPNVVEVRAVFVDGATGVIEMPLYAYGDLWEWLAAAPRTVHDKLRVLRAALCGLEHVHRMGVVHADVKPENVFVDGDGVAKLGDFDVSKGDETRVTMAWTVVGFSPPYAAPEINNGAGASKASDMYAFGLTLFDIVRGETPIAVRPIDVERLARHEPIEDGTSLRDLARQLIAEAPGNRINATDALASPLFAPPEPGRDPAQHQRLCSVCFESRWLDQGVECEQQHFVCNGDLATLAQMFCSWPPSVIVQQGALRCAEAGCASAPWSNACLARSLSDEQFKLYIDRLREVAESRVLIEQRLLRDAELALLERQLRGEMSPDEEVAAHHQAIRVDLLCLQCPLCRTAFIVDFDCCLAMNCGNCRTAFCGWCLKDCGDDAHHHVSYVCELNPTQPRNAYGNAAQFEAVHRHRRAQLVASYLQRVQNDEIRAAVCAAIQRDLDDLGIVLTTEFEFDF
jgi:serine/threonine protein kinase